MLHNGKRPRAWNKDKDKVGYLSLKILKLGKNKIITVN